LYLHKTHYFLLELAVSEADIKCEMKKTILELQSMANELGDALEKAAARVEAADGHIGNSLRDLYERSNARSEELLAQLDRLQTEIVASEPPTMGS
jgi:hypothetical protein